MKKIAKHIKREYIYCLLFIWIFIVDQRTLTAMNVARVAFVQSTIMPFLLIIIINMKLNNVHKKKYVLCAIGLLAVLFIGSVYIYQNEELYLKYIILLIEILLYIFILFYALLNRKNYLNVNKSLNWLSICWIFVLVLMGTSKYNGKWTWIVLFSLIPFILWGISRKELEALVVGATYGIIFSFFILQGVAFLIRPYDNLRYYGIYGNPNVNALFYAIVFTACLSNAMIMQKNGTKKCFQILNAIIACSTIAFIFLTGSKTGILTSLGMFFLFIVVSFQRGRNKIKVTLKNIFLCFVTVVFLIPTCYTAARYMPHIWNYTAFFYGEYNEFKVHSYDPYDSEKYPEPEEIIQLMMERYLGIEIDVTEIKEKFISYNLKNDKNEYNIIFETVEKHVEFEPKLSANIRNKNTEETSLEKEETIEEVLGKESTNGLNSYTGRLYIWKEYIKRINLFGNPMVTTHAHNVFIEHLYYFGIVAGGLFFLLYCVTVFYQLIVAYRTKLPSDFFALTYIALFGVFGMFDLDWFRGQASLSLFYFAICITILGKNSKKKLNEEHEQNMLG